MNYLEEYYNNYDEDGRLLLRHGQVEYITTMKYIHEYLKKGAKVLEVGAGTGRYSVTLAKEGFEVTAVELIQHNIDVMKAKLDGTENIEIFSGNALDLSFLKDGSFDMTLVLGPMYHLYTMDDKKKALSEAARVTKKGGVIMVAYCMNEPTVVEYIFKQDHLKEILANDMLDANWHCKSEEKDLFELIRVEEIEKIDASANVEREKFVATDGATNYMRDVIDSMDDFTFGKWVEYHLSICERGDLAGASHHTLDILRKS